MKQIPCNCSHCGTKFILPDNIIKLTIRYLRENDWIVRVYKCGFYMTKPELTAGHNIHFCEDVDSWEFTSLNLRMLSRLSFILDINNMILLNRILYDHEGSLRDQLAFWKLFQDCTPKEDDINRFQQKIRIQQIEMKLQQEIERKAVCKAYKNEELDNENTNHQP